MSAAIAEVVAVRVPERTWRSEVRAVSVVWRRELLRFTGDRTRMVTSRRDSGAAGVGLMSVY